MLEDDAVLPGFRRGRAPRRLLEKRFAGHVRDDVKNSLLSESYTKALEDNDLDPLSDPQVEDGEKIELPESGDFTFTVSKADEESGDDDTKFVVSWAKAFE